MKQSVADMIVAQALTYLEPFHDRSDQAWCWDGVEALKVGSTAFSDRLNQEFFLSTGKSPGKISLTTASNTLRAMARWDGQEHTVGLRIAGHDGHVVVDLADEEHRVVVIGPDGWDVTAQTPVRFHHPEGMLPLPVPTADGGLDELIELLPLGGEDITLVLGWVLGCFNLSGSKPLLDLSGTQGSGKSTLARMLGAMIDPNAVQLQTMPTEARTLAIIASRHALPIFDNASRVSDELSDALCRLATGGGFETRRLYTDDEVVRFTDIRPVIITGIPEIAKQGDLVDRTIGITLPEFDADARRTEAEVQVAFERIRPGLLGVLFDAAACSLRNLATTVLEERPRMLDFATWVEAGAPALGWESGRFLGAYVANRRAASTGIVESSYIGQFIPELAAQGFTGTPTQALRRLEAIAGLDAHRRRGWPATPRGLVGILRRLAPSLAEVGTDVRFEPRGSQMIITISRDEQAVPDNVVSLTPTEASPAARDVADALLAAGVEASWPIPRTGALALQKSVGDPVLAAAALNLLGVTAPNGRSWTPDVLRGVV